MKKFFEALINPAIFVLIAALLRLLPHAPNFAPIGAMALFGGAYLGRRSAIVLPLSAMFLSDLFIGFDSLESRLTVYGSFAAIGTIGIWLKTHRSFQNVVLAALGSSILFFLVTNFGVWAFGTLYQKTLAGLLTCYVAAIPFFRNSLAGDLFYTGVFFGGYELIFRLAKSKKLVLSVKEVGRNG